MEIVALSGHLHNCADKLYIYCNLESMGENLVQVYILLDTWTCHFINHFSRHDVGSL